VAGIVGGSNLVKSSKIRTLIGEAVSVQTAYNTFKLSFDQVPGDFDKAYDYWGANCDVTPSKCNGNGNKFIGVAPQDSGSTNQTDDLESHRAWQHFSLSGIMPQSFSGKSIFNIDVVTKQDIFFSSTGRARFFLNNRKANNGIFGKHAMNNLLTAGSPKIENIWQKTFTVAEAITIDKKMDDGIANSGQVLGITGGWVANDTSCSQQLNHPTGADYNISNLTSPSLQFVMVFAFFK
jgi:hypothetical protein